MSKKKSSPFYTEIPHYHCFIKDTSKTVQNELLECMLWVLRDCILEDVKTADYLAIQADETTDIATHCQLVLVLYYIGQPE